MTFDDHDRAEFIRNTIPSGDCRLVINYHQRKHGRQYVQFRGGLRNAVELTYHLFIGELPANTRPHHKCATSGCVEPSHLYAARLRIEVRRKEAARVG